MTVAVRRASGLLVSLFVVLTTFIGLPATASPLPTAAAAIRLQEGYGYCYYAHGYWHCRKDIGDWWWYEGQDKCYKRDQWYCHDPKGHGGEHGHGGGY